MKALYRRAQAYIQLADLDLAELDIKKALEIDPNNRFCPSQVSGFSLTVFCLMEKLKCSHFFLR